MPQVNRALISVADKTGLAEFCKSLIKNNIELISTGGTATVLRDAGLQVTDVIDITGFPEIMDGRVKTLHPAVHGGLLGRRVTDRDVMAEHGIRPIDLLVVNLYPFEATVARDDCTDELAIENIDIGGPAMIRAAAKNHADVAVVVDPDDYAAIAEEIAAGGGAVSAETCRRLAMQAYAHTACYDAAIWDYLRRRADAPSLPPQYPVGLRRISELRYGENPHQRAAFYALPDVRRDTLAHARQHQGKPLSYNNLADADAALECVRTLPEPACVIVKHANPCGVGAGKSALQAYRRAYATDPTSAFGGIVAFNTPVDADVATEATGQRFLEVLVAPSFSEGALRVLQPKSKLRVLETGPLGPPGAGLRLQPIEGGVLVQDKDSTPPDTDAFRVVSRRQPTVGERADALFAWLVVRFVKSNAIVYCRDGATLGVGAGQMSRVVSARIAAMKAAEAGLGLAGATMASDAFFPFRDGIDTAAQHGISVVIQPGGSVRDEEVIAAADEHGIAMIFTGTRHFRH